MNKRLLTIVLIYGSLIAAAAETQDDIFSYWTKDTWHVGVAEQHTRVYEDNEKEIYYVRDTQHPYYACAKVKDKKEGIDVLCKTEVRDGMVLFGLFESADEPTMRKVANALFEKIDPKKMSEVKDFSIEDRFSSEFLGHVQQITHTFDVQYMKRQNEIMNSKQAMNSMDSSDEESGYQIFRNRFCSKPRVAVQLLAVFARSRGSEVDYRAVEVLPMPDYHGYAPCPSNKLIYTMGWNARLCKAEKTFLSAGFREFTPDEMECLNDMTNIIAAARNLARVIPEADALCKPTHKTHVHAILDIPKMMEVAKESLMRMYSQQKQSMRAKEVIYSDIQRLFQEPVTDDEVEACIDSVDQIASHEYIDCLEKS